MSWMTDGPPPAFVLAGAAYIGQLVAEQDAALVKAGAMIGPADIEEAETYADGPRRCEEAILIGWTGGRGEDQLASMIAIARAAYILNTVRLFDLDATTSNIIPFPVPWS